ncbi:MAG: hypothetical protein QN183_13705 [Armatimonadota bacterium]|nr:hypothetical protein [Armatimonadota bacterium]
MEQVVFTLAEIARLTGRPLCTWRYWAHRRRLLRPVFVDEGAGYYLWEQALAVHMSRPRRTRLRDVLRRVLSGGERP